MSFWTFLQEAVRRSFHKTWKFVETSEVALAVLIYAASAVFHEVKEYLGLAFVGLLGIAVLTFLCRIFWGAYAIYREADAARVLLSTGPTDLVKERDALRAELDTICAANTQLFHQGGFARGNIALLDCEQVVFIEKDGTFRGTTNTTFRAVDRAAIVDADLEGDSAVEPLADLDIQARGDARHKVIVLPAQQTPTAKKVLVVFVPEVTAGETVSYAISWKWPRLWERFLTQAADSWRHEAMSAAPIPVLRFRFKLAKGLPHIKLTNIRDGGGEQVHPADPQGSDGYSEYVWEMKSVQPGTKVEIRLEKW